MSRFNKRTASAVQNNVQPLFKENPRAFADYTLRTNLIEGGSQEGPLSQFELGVALNEENILKYKLLLAQLLNKPFISVN
ncbi:MAG: hypothetical protein V4616_15315 [Bacteroidota bacterium]